MKRIKRSVMICLITLPFAATAHQADNANITWEEFGDSIRMTWDIPSAEVKAAVGGSKGDKRRGRFEQLAYQSISIRSESDLCAITHKRTDSVRIQSRQYVRLISDIHCPHDHTLLLSYRLFRNLNPSHRAVLRVHGQRYLLGADSKPVAITH